MNFKRTLAKIAVVFSVFASGVTVANVANNNNQEAQAASVTSKRNAVAKLANKQVGKKYVYGATGPYSFDCSGLTQYVYKKAAKKDISRTTYTQVKKGKRVSLKHLKKGDLLFWGGVTSPYHVGVYVGGGKYVHAATPSQGVRKQAISMYFYPSAAKRVLN